LSDTSRDPRSGGDAGRRRGPHLGPVRITPVRVTLLVALLGGLGFLAWSVLVRDQLQVPMMATGFAVCGIVFAVTAVLSVIATVRAGREGRDAAAVMTALVGGLVAVGALLFLSAAVIMSMIWGGTSTT
jgi:heme A synthase